VTGVELPGDIDGIEFITRICTSDDTNKIPIVVLTASGQADQRKRAEQAGCNVFLERPCLPDDLLRDIRRVVALARMRDVRPKAAKPHSPATLERRTRKRTG